MSAKGLTTEKRVLVAITAISSFILGMILSQWIFSYYQIESVTSGVMSVVSGTIIAWIVLMLSGILKEFTIKGIGFEVSSTLKELKDEVKKGSEKIESDIKSVNNRIDTVMSNQMNVSMSPSFKLINNMREINRTEDEIQKTESALSTSDKIPTGKIDLDNPVSITPEVESKLDTLIQKQSELQSRMNEIDDFPVDVMKSLRNANYYYSTKKYEKSLKILKRILQDDPNNINALQNSSYNYSGLKDFDNALKFAKKILQIDPINRDGLGSESHYLIRANQLPEAKKTIEKLVTRYPKYSLGWFNKACIESLENETKESIKSLKKAIKLTSRYKETAMTDSDLKNIQDLEEFKDLTKS